MMNEQLPILPPEIRLFDIWHKLKDFEDFVAPLPSNLEKDYKVLVPQLIPLMDNYYQCESVVGAYVYNLWEEKAYTGIDQDAMELYTDALMTLADALETILYDNDCYNFEGINIYAFSTMLGNTLVMRLKELPTSEYVLF